MMLEPGTLVHLFENVFENDVAQFNITSESMKSAIKSINYVYAKETSTLESAISTVVDYNDVAHRCAYLYKFAVLHTTMVQTNVKEVILNNREFFRALVSDVGQFKICSLGGGPGCDVIGVLSALYSSFSFFEASATIVDYMENWKDSFGSILTEMSSEIYGPFARNVSSSLNWKYIGANLLIPFKQEVDDELSEASLVTMIKFISATACHRTNSMIENVFQAMKPGAALLYIDNDGGGYRELMIAAAKKFGFITVFGPKRSWFTDKHRRKLYGYSRCSKTRVTVLILRKPVQMETLNNICEERVKNLASPRLSTEPLSETFHSPVLHKNDTTKEPKPGNSMTPDEYEISSNDENTVKVQRTGSKRSRERRNSERKNKKREETSKDKKSKTKAKV